MAEKDMASANYIVTFFQDIEGLSWQSANYMNLMIELKKKYNKGIDDDEGISEEERNSFVSIAQQFRAFALRVYTKYMALKGTASGLDWELDESGKTVDENYKGKKHWFSEELLTSLNKVLVADPVQKDVLDYNILMNTVFVKGVMSEFLMKSNDIITGLTA